MTKRLKLIALIIGALAILGMGVNLWAYSQLKEILVPEQTILPPVVDTITLGIVISFLFIIIFHLTLLFHTFYFLPRMTEKFFFGALFFCGLVLSGLYIASDLALLSDLGKEYLLWDVRMEWAMLTITSSMQLVIMVIGFFLLMLNKEKSPFALFPKADKLDESTYIIVTQVGLLCGINGLLMLFLPTLMNVGNYYRPMYMVTLSLLALLPFISSVIYWLLRNRGKKLPQILDEKQFQDVSFGGLLAVFVLVFAIAAGLILSQQGLIDLNDPLYSLITINLLVIIISSTVLIRSKV